MATLATVPAPLPPLEGGQRVAATIAVASAVFMNVLDMTIANVSIPAIAGDLGASPAQGTWIITSFSVANAISLPLTGWLAQRFGQVRLFVLSTLLFVLASFLCGLSNSLGMLVACRILQGFVAGPMLPLSQTLIMQVYPREKMGVALTIWALTSMLGPVLGPNLGGLITDHFSWPWIFYINIPVGLLTAWVCWLLMKDRDSQRVRKPVDVVGLALLVLWVGALQLMIDKGRELDWFQSGEIRLLAVAAAAGFALFLVWEWYEEHPVVELRLFAMRNLTVGTLLGAVGFGLYFGGVVLLPLWMQQTLGYTATLAGMLSSPVGLVSLVLSPFVGRYLVGKVDPRIMATFAFLVFALGNFLRARFVAEIDPLAIAIPQLVLGVAVAFFFVPLTSMSLSGVPSDKVAAASGLSNFVRIMVSALITSVGMTLWDNWTIAHRAHMVEHVSVFEPVTTVFLGHLQSLGLDMVAGLSVLERQIGLQAHTLALDEFFWASAWIFLALIPLIWLARPVHAAGPAKAPPAGEH